MHSSHAETKQTEVKKTSRSGQENVQIRSRKRLIRSKNRRDQVKKASSIAYVYSGDRNTVFAGGPLTTTISVLLLAPHGCTRVRAGCGPAVDIGRHSDVIGRALRRRQYCDFKRIRRQRYPYSRARKWGGSSKNSLAPVQLFADCNTAIVGVGGGECTPNLCSSGRPGTAAASANESWR